ncbi:hypothetical protein Tco_1563269 [Tanacetum coccineum]
MEESLSKFMAESTKIHDENSNLIKEIQAATDAAIQNQGASIKALEIQIEQMGKVIQERRSGIPFPSRLIDDKYEDIDVLDSTTYLKKMHKERPKMGYQIETSINMNDSVVLEDSLPPKEKYPGSLGELAPTKLVVELADRTIKHPKARLMGETLILNRSLDPNFRDFIELNDLNEPLELRRNQVEDLRPMIEGGEVIDKPMVDIIETRNDDGKSKGINNCGSMDPYRDQEMGDVIVGEPFCREICVKARRFDGIITIYNGECTRQAEWNLAPVSKAQKFLQRSQYGVSSYTDTAYRHPDLADT